MFERFTEGARRAVLAAVEEAQAGRGDPRVGTEHLLFGVAAVGDVVAVRLGITPEAVHHELAAWDLEALASVGLEPDRAVVATPSPRRRWRSRWFRKGHIPFTAGAKGALERSLHICQGEGHRSIGTAHVLAALATGSPRDPATRVLLRIGVEPAELDAAIRRYWHAA